MNIVIREAIEQDIEIILQQTLKLHFHENDEEIPVHPNFEQNLKKWLEFELKNPQSLVLIVEDKLEKKSLPMHTKPISIGFICATSVINDNGFLENPVKGVIQLIWIEEQYRRKKIAEQLIENIERCFKGLGINYVEATYTNKNKLAAEFWNQNLYKPNSITVRKIL
jgi:ribosomal protein S18 acetylase RimI-like enzyme